MSNRGDYALEQEKYSVELIEKANTEQDDLLKLAKEMAAKELESFNEEKRVECEEDITKLNANDDIIEEIEINQKQKLML